MACKDTLKEEDGRFLRFLYCTVFGRVLLKLCTARWISRIAGCFLDSGLSKLLISGFCRKNQIDLSDYQVQEYRSFNDFFTRKIRAELRPIDFTPDAFVAPCDGLLSVYRLSEDTVVPAKQSHYRIGDLLGSPILAKQFNGGLCLVFRLCVNHYHRYHYLDNGTKTDNFFLAGKLHTVRPIALRTLPVFCENCREYTLLHTENFGTVAQIEVGAMLVGKIENYRQAGVIHRGEEKGRFLYGGSTVILLTEPGKVSLPESYFSATERQIEIPVKMGQRLNMTQAPAPDEMQTTESVPLACVSSLSN